MINILNNHPAYEVFRKEREKQISKGKWNYEKLLVGIAPWSTNERYPKIIYQDPSQINNVLDTATDLLQQGEEFFQN